MMKILELWNSILYPNFRASFVTIILFNGITPSYIIIKHAVQCSALTIPQFNFT
jgi:hypothetical protein